MYRSGSDTGFYDKCSAVFVRYNVVWRLLINCSLTTIVLRLNEIQYCLIVAKSSLEILAYHSLRKNQTRKIQKSSNKKCDN